MPTHFLPVTSAYVSGTQLAPLPRPPWSICHLAFPQDSQLHLLSVGASYGLISTSTVCVLFSDNITPISFCQLYYLINLRSPSSPLCACPKPCILLLRLSVAASLRIFVSHAAQYLPERMSMPHISQCKNATESGVTSNRSSFSIKC